jgi:shikimate kinase
MGNLIFSLVGPKHCGKTEIGRRAAEKLSGVFLDLDELTGALSGSTPRELYKESKQRFQEAETASVCKALARSAETAVPAIIAAGGGIIDNREAFSLLKESARLIYLEVSAALSWTRIEAARKNGQGLPPFLDTGDPRKAHEELHERRGKAYKAAADHVILAENKSIEELCRELTTYITHRAEQADGQCRNTTDIHSQTSCGNIQKYYQDL